MRAAIRRLRMALSVLLHRVADCVAGWDPRDWVTISMEPDATNGWKAPDGCPGGEHVFRAESDTGARFVVTVSENRVEVHSSTPPIVTGPEDHDWGEPWKAPA